MAQDGEAFLARWSRLKREERAEGEEKNRQLPEQKKQEEPAPPLPPLEKLTPQSDFSPFMHPKVQDAVRRVALKKLFSDPHFNVPDLNEAYSGDWTGGEPISEEMLKTLNQARTLLFPEEEKKKDESPQAPEKDREDESGRQDA